LKISYRKPEAFRSHTDLQTMVFVPFPGGEIGERVLDTFREAAFQGFVERAEIRVSGTTWVWPASAPGKKK
jgi:hypothetical protein